MKFGEKLEAYAVPEWADNYLKYKALKKFLKKCRTKVNSASLSSSRVLGGFFKHYSISPLVSVNQIDAERSPLSILPLKTACEENLKEKKRKRKLQETTDCFGQKENEKISFSTSDIAEGKIEVDMVKSFGGQASCGSLVVPLLNPLLEYDKEFLDKLDEELKKVENHFIDELKLIEEHLNGVHSELTDIEMKDILNNDSHTKAICAHRKRLQKGIVSIWIEVDKLESFIKMNIMALYKILKKRDKLFNINNLYFDYQKRSCALNSLIIPQTMKDKILDLYSRAGVVKGDNTDNFQNLQAAVQKHIMQQLHPNYAWVSCFIGACSVLLLDIIIMFFIPETNPRYNLDFILAVLPIFRFVLMFVLFHWGMAVSMALMEMYGVNYKFILEIDSKCQVNASTIFTLASFQTIIWIATMGLFLADYKFVVFGVHNLYWLYPILLLAAESVIFLLPNRTFRNKYRKDILVVIFNVFKSGVLGVSEVTLVQNVVGDILTSFSKPLGDLEYTVCYFSTGLYHEEPTTCPIADFWLKTFLIGFPYYLRFMQCVIRFRGESERKNRYIHLANALKYSFGMGVVVSTSIPWEELGMSLFLSRLIWVFSYICATLYMFVWDIYMDWGLMPDPDHFLRLNGRMMYPKFVYYFVAFTNLVARLTWAMTLMPIDILENKKLNSNLLTFFISAMEIYRRSAWTVIRLENEHLTNSSRYRAILFVPRLYVNDKEPIAVSDDFAREKKINSFWRKQPKKE